ncbi:unnamed protein product (macronuclear) [Paramecium tetraurelia]|uniref:Transmembrane protein n=1 Tax=Paramecium tetraurelia TaxID=5888 RepID=A0EDI9_PARTE|nr:uncharacterized protein GSPATT00025699001 [Paramecium tetraurelia]CAK93356.1 unnamed protein product [Paramecium tetraurelia]|eukprot:XP_001460753.1 hypothetical protein (macronuclear) [Paramecium tetraurelia strain d4-2]
MEYHYLNSITIKPRNYKVQEEIKLKYIINFKTFEIFRLYQYIHLVFLYTNHVKMFAVYPYNNLFKSTINTNHNNFLLKYSILRQQKQQKKILTKNQPVIIDYRNYILLEYQYMLSKFLLTTPPILKQISDKYSSYEMQQQYLCKSPRSSNQQQSQIKTIKIQYIKNIHVFGRKQIIPQLFKRNLEAVNGFLFFLNQQFSPQSVDYILQKVITFYIY